MFSLPDKGEGAHDVQSIMFQEHLDVLMAGLLGTDCVLTGLDVTAQGSPNMTVAVAKGSVLSNGALFAVAANASVTISAANATNPRLDYVVITSAGAIAVRAGTAAAVPKPPARTANDVVLAMVYVPANDTTISTNQITDLRIIRGGSANGGGAPILLKKVTTPVTFNTTSAIQTYFTLTVPSGMLLAGQIIHVECGGTILCNSGTPTFTLTISFGGTTMFADVTTAGAADADRIPWRLEFDLIGQGTSDQALNGQLHFGQLTAKTAPTTGVGEMLTPTAVANIQPAVPLNGSSAVNADTGNQDLLVRWTMSVSNAADEVSMEFATAQLV